MARSGVRVIPQACKEESAQLDGIRAGAMLDAGPRLPRISVYALAQARLRMAAEPEDLSKHNVDGRGCRMVIAGWTSR